MSVVDDNFVDIEEKGTVDKASEIDTTEESVEFLKVAKTKTCVGNKFKTKMKQKISNFL